MRSTLLASLALALAACHAARETPVAAQPAPPAPACPVAPACPLVLEPQADDVLTATLWAQRAVEHDAVVAQVYKLARTQLDRVLADKTVDALATPERSKHDKALPPAIIFDVDETVLDNSPFQARLVERGLDFDQWTWDDWARAAKAKPLPGALEFAKYAASRGVAVFYVTNRNLDAKKPTDDNLRAAGFPFNAKEPSLVVAGEPSECAAAGSAKGCRRALIGRAHRVVMLVGDQLSDFIDLKPNTYDARDAAAKEYAAWFGERWVMLPNPMYGSWEAAASSTLPKGATREEERAAKRAALRAEH